MKKYKAFTFVSSWLITALVYFCASMLLIANFINHPDLNSSGTHIATFLSIPVTKYVMEYNSNGFVANVTNYPMFNFLPFLLTIILLALTVPCVKLIKKRFTNHAL